MYQLICPEFLSSPEAFSLPAIFNFHRHMEEATKLRLLAWTPKDVAPDTTTCNSLQ